MKYTYGVFTTHKPSAIYNSSIKVTFRIANTEDKYELIVIVLLTQRESALNTLNRMYRFVLSAAYDRNNLLFLSVL